MSQPSSGSSIPYALDTTHRELRAVLNRAIEQYRANNASTALGREVCLAVERFVREFMRVPGGEAEFGRRAGLVERLCGPQTAHDSARGDAWPVYLQRKVETALPAERHWVSSAQYTPPTLLAQVDERRDTLDRMLRDTLPECDRAVLEKWRNECIAVQSEAGMLCVDGCHVMYHAYEGATAETSTRSSLLRYVLERGTIGGAQFPSILEAADSLIAWAIESEHERIEREALERARMLFGALPGALRTASPYQKVGSASVGNVGVNSEVRVNIDVAAITQPTPTSAGKPDRTDGNVLAPPAGKTEQGEENDLADRAPLPLSPPIGKAEQGNEFCFARSGTGYFIKGFGELGHVRKLKGFEHIASLIKTPRQPVPMRELVQGNMATAPLDSRSRQPALDEQAKKELFDRLQEARQDLEQSKQENNTVEQAHCEEEIAHLTKQLGAAVGIGGRTRDLNSETEKLRPTISANLKRACKALRETVPPMKELAAHFEAAISAEGNNFVYRPPSPDFVWSLELPRAEVTQ